MLKNKKSIKKNILVTTVIFAFSIIFAFVLIEKYFLENEFKKQILQSSYQDISKKQKDVVTLIENTKNTLVDIYEMPIFKNAMAENNFQNISNIFYTIAQSNTYFMQLRYLDKDGFEKIRVDRVKNQINPLLVKENDFQNKSNRDYFIDAKNTKNIFISKLNLNKENNTIEFPYKPTVRVVLPIFEKDIFNGILIANLSINLFMESFLFDTMIADESRNVILPFDKSKKDFLKNLTDLFPNDTNEIISKNIYIKDDFISYKLQTEIQNKIIFIAKLKKEYFEDFQHDQLKLRILIFIALLIFSSILIYYFLKIIDKLFYAYHKLLLDEKIKYSNQEFDNSNKLISEEIDPELIISQAKTSMILTDSQCNIIYVNESFTKLFGYNANDVIGTNPRFLNQDDREQSGLEKVRVALKNEKPTTVVLRNYSVDNKLKYIELSISPIFEKETNKLKYFLGVHKDVTKEQKIMRDLRRIF